MRNLKNRSTKDLNRAAASLRNRRDAFSHGSRHADEFVQELAAVNRELERRRDERHLGWVSVNPGRSGGPFVRG